jgi:hypothetical protein
VPSPASPRFKSWLVAVQAIVMNRLNGHLGSC